MTSNFRTLRAVTAASFALCTAFTVSTAQAGFFHKHPMMAGIGAGMAAHHMAKHAGRHGHHGMMARHPMMTGMAAGMAAHHMAKKH